MTPDEIAEVRRAAERVGYTCAKEAFADWARRYDPYSTLLLLGAFTDYLMRRPGGVAITADNGVGCMVTPASASDPYDLHPNPIVALARAVNATEDTP